MPHLTPALQTLQVRQETYRPLPPLYISKIVDDLPCQNISEPDLTLRKIKYIVSCSYLIYHNEHEPFKFRNEITLASHRIIAYSATRRQPDPLMIALEPIENSDEIDEEEGRREFLFFIIRPFTTPFVRQEVYVLSTPCAYKIIRGFCSTEFSRNVCASLANQIIKVEQVVTQQLLGPISESELSFRNFLPTHIDQSGLVCREVTLLVCSFVACLPGSQVKIKFSDKGVIIYRELSIQNHIDITHFFATQQSLVFPQGEWGLSNIPEEFSPEQDPRVTDYLEQMLISYMIEDPGEKLINWSFDLDLTTRLYERASEFRLRYKVPKAVNSYFSVTSFSDPYYPFNFNELRSCVCNLYASKWIANTGIYLDNSEANVENVFKHKHVCIEYKEDDVWLSQDVLDCVEGCVKVPDGQVFFRLGGRWYRASAQYEQRVNSALFQIISESTIFPQNLGYLSIPWSNSMNEETYNREYPKLIGNGVWLDGNRKRQSLGVEIGDIIYINQNQVFIYHVKKHFNNTIRDAVTQLIMSAQVLRNQINSGLNNHPENALYQYCESVAGNKRDLLLGTLTKGQCHFVLAFPLWINMTNGPLPYQSFIQYTLTQSHSITAKREVIRAKSEIEKLGFSFKMSVIQGY